VHIALLVMKGLVVVLFVVIVASMRFVALAVIVELAPAMIPPLAPMTPNQLNGVESSISRASPFV
jgi:ABC-type phosphate transport system permease subunit